MPLPKPPARKAALLAPSDFESQAAPKTGKKTLKPSPAAEPAAPVLDLYDAAAAVSSATVETSPTTLVPPPRVLPEPHLRRRPRGNGPAKLFVLDTTVLMHDPTSLFRFEEHDIYLPMITLEELDGQKKGMSEVARNVRQVSRDLDALAAEGLSDP